MAIALNTINRQAPGGEGKQTVNFSSSTLNAGGGGAVIADPGAGFAIVIEQIKIDYPAADTLTIREDTTTIIGPLTFLTTAKEYTYKPTDPLIITANKELNLLTGGANAISGQIDYKILPT
jgi:hypothetical protein